MSQFKRFNTSENDNYNSSDAFPEGTLTWDPSNGLRLHDGNTGGGTAVGSSNFYDLTNRPTGNTAVHDLQGGSSSLLNGYFLKQTTTGVSEWTALPTTYDTLTIDTKIIGGIDGAAGTQITGIEASLGSGVPWQYAFLGGNDAFGDLFNRGSAIIGWKMYPASDPSAFVTITEFLNNDLGAPSLGFSGSLGQGPWIAESSDYDAGTDGPLTLSAGTKDLVLGTDGSTQLPGSLRFGENEGSADITPSYSDTPVRILITDSNTPALHIWQFGVDGNLTLTAGGTIKDSSGNTAFVAVSILKQLVADSTDFADFKSKIASM